MPRSFSAILGLSFIILLASCSSGSGGSGGGTPSPNHAFVPGKWTAFLFNPALVSSAIAELDMNIVQSGNTISSDELNTVDNTECGGLHSDSTTGTVAGDNFTLIFSIGTETITLTGTIGPDGKSIGTFPQTGTFTSSGGPCLNGQSGTFSANFIPPLTGQFTGMLIEDAPGISGPKKVTATLVEAANFTFSGSMNIVDEPCFPVIATEPDNPGTSIGSITTVEMDDGSNFVVFIGGVQVVTDLDEYNAAWNVIAGCTQEFGGLELDIPTSPAMAPTRANNAPLAAAKINSVLVERVKALLARREHTD